MNAKLSPDDFRGQCAAVFRRLKCGPLTSLQALRELGVARLAAVVLRLKDAGVEIDARLETVNKATGGVARVAVYSPARGEVA